MRDFERPGRSAVYATNGMCATSHPLAAKVAIQMLEAGGNAVDAAIAGAVLLGLCEPQMTGIGGDCFALVAPSPDAPVIALNGSGRAPKRFDPEPLRAAGHTRIPRHDPAAITIPGAVDAFCTLARDHGRLGLKAALAPAIHYADAGIPVAPRVAFDWANEGGALFNESARNRFNVQGKAPSAGTLFRAPDQAEVLRRIALEGRDGFYSGEVADDMVATLQAFGGSHTLEDFEQTASTYTNPVSGQYAGRELLEHPPNGQGATAHLILNILRNFDLASMDPFGAERAHIEAEATKLAYDARNRFIADPAHTTKLDTFLSEETANKLAALIDPNQALASATKLTEEVHRDTIYITVVDRDRMTVSLIYSIFSGFGSGIASDRFGILFHNRGQGFNLTEGHPNEAGAGKRPMHTIIPAIVRENGRASMPFGVMGGAYQACGHARFLTNIADFGFDPQSAIDGPRCFAEDDTLRIENSYAPDVRSALADKGHKLRLNEGPIGGAQAIEIREDGVLIGASDPRKDGCALGY